ncbi:MAG: L-aspartate oxidase [Oligoflexia bacterium]|nr:L-aspartate oxidase [Oligoflexia bacterium]
MSETFLKFDVVVIGSGVAGLNLSRLADKNLSIALVTKTFLGDGASVLAQGGIATVSLMNSRDSFASHIEDTEISGCGLCNHNIVEFCVKSGPEVIQDLLDIGVDFTRSETPEKNYKLTKEGGHSHRRIYYSEDTTGRAIIDRLLLEVRDLRNVAVFEHHTVINLIKDNTNRIVGVYVLDTETMAIKTVLAGSVVIATGGAGKAYLYTSNPDTATGDGIAMAYRAGAEIANMEFFQFHPTCLYHPEAKNFLISETVRGEGGILRHKNGNRFMKKYHDSGELAPRDIVARAIDTEMKRTGADCLYLDITHKGKPFIKKRFPNIYNKCMELGIDISTDWIPVVPAAHYSCGGIRVDIDGKTSLKGLFACGECSSTGLHGANRLASNSLLEALVFSRRIASQLKNEVVDVGMIRDIPQWEASWVKPAEETILVHHNWDELRRVMWNNVGIVRRMNRLQNALKRIDMIKNETESYYWKHDVSKDLIELRNIITVAELIVFSAMSRKESRGLHYNSDFPNINDKLATDTVIFLPHD